MKYKIILFDIDGVLIRTPHYFGKQLELNGYKDAEKILQDFYSGAYIPCALGRADIKKEILPTLTKLGWKKCVDDFFREQFTFEIQYFDKTFLDIISGLRSKNIGCYLASSQEKYKIEYLWNTLGWKNIFDGKYISCDIGERKEQSEYWEYALEDVQKNGIERQEILFFDDSQKVIDKALEFGITSHIFTNMESFQRDLERHDIIG